MKRPIVCSLLFVSPVLALDGEDEVDFNIRPGGQIGTSPSFEALAASSDLEQSVVAATIGNSMGLQVLTSDGRGLPMDPAMGGFGVPETLVSGTGGILLDEEGVRVSGDQAVVAWIESASAGGAGSLRFVQRTGVSTPWSPASSVASLPAGNAEGAEIVLTREAQPTLEIAAQVDGDLWLTTSTDLGGSFTLAQLASASNSPIEVFDFEGQAQRVLVCYSDQRGPSGADAVWIRSGVLDPLGTGLLLDPEQLLFSELGTDVLRIEVAMEGDRASVAFLTADNSLDQRVRWAHSSDFAVNWTTVETLPETTGGLSLIHI